MALMMPALPTQSKLFRPVRGMMIRLVSLALPPLCISCRDVLDSPEGLGICPTCWRKLPVWNTTALPGPSLPGRVDSFVAPMLYDSPIRDLIIRFKFADTPEFAHTLARLMVPTLPTGDLLDKPLLVPVPLHPRRLWTRQFNQAALLARALARHTGLPVDITALRRTRSTAHQTGQAASTRRRQLSGAFAATEVVAGREIVLIDDVWTTGSTANACAIALKKAGATKVHVRTIAYVAP